MQMKTNPTIQISYDLFKDLCIYAYRHAEPEDLQYKRLLAGIRHKLEATKRRMVYSQYKSGPSSAERESARQDYLDLAGVLTDCRWSARCDVNVTHSTEGTLFETPD